MGDKLKDLKGKLEKSEEYITQLYGEGVLSGFPKESLGCENLVRTIVKIMLVFRQEDKITAEIQNARKLPTPKINSFFGFTLDPLTLPRGSESLMLEPRAKPVTK